MSFAPSILIEFGLIGAVLFLLIVFEGIQSLFRSKSKEKLLILTLILGAILTTFVVNNFDYIPFYLIIGGVKNLNSNRD
jgi:Na+/H+ antiporter NhaC